MTTIFYKKVLGSYEISEVCEAPGEEVVLEFEEPIDGKIVIASSVFELSHGVCKAKTAKLPDGEISPKLYTGGIIEKIESFIHKSGTVIQKAPDADYVKRLAITVDAIFCRIQRLERLLGEIENKIERKITF